MSTMSDWLEQVQHELGIDLDLNLTELLDLTKVVAHEVARPAAPLTAFLVGYAAAAAGGGTQAVTDACQQVTALAEAHSGADLADPQ